MTITDNTIEIKNFHFAVRIVKLCKHLRGTKKEYTLTKQLLCSGTSIGANVAEAQQAQSRPDFVSKLNIALKEAAETNYWLRLLLQQIICQKRNFLQFIRIAGSLRSC